MISKIERNDYVPLWGGQLLWPNLQLQSQSLTKHYRAFYSIYSLLTAKTLTTYGPTNNEGRLSSGTYLIKLTLLHWVNTNYISNRYYWGNVTLYMKKHSNYHQSRGIRLGPWCVFWGTFSLFPILKFSTNLVLIILWVSMA